MNKPATHSTAEAIALGSKARVLNASTKTSAIGLDPVTGMPVLSRKMTDEDARASMVRKYGH